MHTTKANVEGVNIIVMNKHRKYQFPNLENENLSQITETPVKLLQ